MSCWTVWTKDRQVPSLAKGWTGLNYPLAHYCFPRVLGTQTVPAFSPLTPGALSVSHLLGGGPRPCPCVGGRGCPFPHARPGEGTEALRGGPPLDGQLVGLTGRPTGEPSPCSASASGRCSAKPGSEAVGSLRGGCVAGKGHSISPNGSSSRSTHAPPSASNRLCCQRCLLGDG